MWKIFFTSTIGTQEGLFRTFQKTTYVLILALGILVPRRSGILNIGGLGQMTVGTILTVGICLYLPVPDILKVILSFVCTFIVAGVVAGFLGYLKGRWDINEIFLAIMINFVIVAIMTYLIDNPWRMPVSGISKTLPIPEGTMFPFVAQYLNSVFIVALIMIIPVWILIDRTVFGYELKVVGAGKRVAENQGINVNKLYTLSMFISGGICGLAGTVIILGEIFRLIGGITGLLGFMAVPAALMVKGRAELALFSSFFIAVILQGALGLMSIGLHTRLGEAMVGLVFISVMVSEKIRR